MTEPIIVLTKEEVAEKNSEPRTIYTPTGRSLRALAPPKKVKQVVPYMPTEDDNFIHEFLKNGGNATEAAMKAYGITSRPSASMKGNKTIRKFPEIVRMYMETKGASYGKLVDLLIDKAYQAKTPEFLDRAFKLAGYADFMNTKQTTDLTAGTVTIINTQKALASEYVEGEVEEEEGKEDEDESKATD